MALPATALTPEMALRIEKAFGPDMGHLLRMQLAYEVAEFASKRGRSPSSVTSRRQREAP